MPLEQGGVLIVSDLQFLWFHPKSRLNLVAINEERERGTRDVEHYTRVSVRDMIEQPLWQRSSKKLHTLNEILDQINALWIFFQSALRYLIL